MAAQPELELSGIGVAPGIVFGPALVLPADDVAPPDFAIPPEAVEHETLRFERALLATRRQLNDLQTRVSLAMGTESARIFEAHLHVVDDPSFVDEIYHDLRAELRNIESITYRVAERYAQALQQMEDDYLRERATDIRDVTRRILRNLGGGGSELVGSFDAPRVLIARDISPSELAAYDRSKLLGMVTELGSLTAHTAILARAMDLPAIVGLRGATARVPEGSAVILDGARGVLVVNPTAERTAEYQRLARGQQAIQQRLATLKDELAVTRDGHLVELSANIELPADADMALARGARGIGLFRSEYLFLAGNGEPTEDAQYQAYADVARKIHPEPVIIRTLDLGGDKLLADGRAHTEANPFLGWRAIRLCLDRPDFFKTQLRAILRASAHNPRVRIMYPMISSAAEVTQANALLAECKQDLAAAGVPFNSAIETGVMIEIPAAALTAELIAPHVQFFSIGTNDLVQYTLAVDRGNERVASLYDPAHPAVLQLIQRTVAAGQRHGIWTGVCGEAASNPLFVPLLLGLGVTELSVGPGAVPLVKDVIRHIHLAAAQDLAREALALADGAAIRSRCRDFVRECAPEILELAG
ncbi:MAG TPA: phosphoenolpyruvate--protein phosphotransferase [Kiritimatiellia bacterium]|nr:phosphoenolpyruvate--protein phosphotransferase [Kiritimatiellia bacterium]